MIKTVAELKALREQVLQTIALRGDEKLASVKSDYKRNVLVCGGTGCTSSNSKKIVEALKREIAANGLQNDVKVVTTGCFGLCALGPIMIVYPEGSFYSMVKVDDIPEIVKEHFVNGNVVTRLLYEETVGECGKIKSLNETEFTV